MKKKVTIKQRIIPEFFFPQTIQKIKETRDSKFLLATGLYPPQIKCFDLNNLTVKFKRHLDYEVQDFQILTSNWEKLVFLRKDRYLEFHSKSGCHYQLKLKSQTIDLVLDPINNILYSPSTSNEIFRLDLSEGKFLQSLKTDPEVFLSCSGISPVSNLIGVGTSLGYTQFWDPRILKRPVGVINNFSITGKNKNSVTTIRFNPQVNYLCYTGHKYGQTIIWDLRSFGPILVKKMKKRTPIKTIRVNFKKNTILTSDEKTISLWDEKTGKTWNIIGTQTKINHICSIKNSGFIFIATENPFPETRFIQNLGEFPRWALNCTLNNRKEGKKFQKLKKKFATEKNFGKKELSSGSFL
mmetsp:Transcript_99809/g.149501  ORF Transcript_99809/g.149501 Transcript_99809/m.149501 type:complete len:354 (-) Transcript_99809:703-1764(-)